MSPRAAWRLESLGFGEVYNYIASKVDWLAFGLPGEGDEAATPRAGDIPRRELTPVLWTESVEAAMGIGCIFSSNSTGVA